MSGVIVTSTKYDKQGPSSGEVTGLDQQLHEDTYNMADKIDEIMNQSEDFRLRLFPGKFHAGYGTKDLREKLYNGLWDGANQKFQMANVFQQPVFVVLSDLFLDLDQDVEIISIVREAGGLEPFLSDDDLQSWKRSVLEKWIQSGGTVSENLSSGSGDPYDALNYKHTVLTDSRLAVGDHSNLRRMMTGNRDYNLVTQKAERHNFLLQIPSFHELNESRLREVTILDGQLRSAKARKEMDLARQIKDRLRIRKSKKMAMQTYQELFDERVGVLGRNLANRGEKIDLLEISSEFYFEDISCFDFNSRLLQKMRKSCTGVEILKLPRLRRKQRYILRKTLANR